MSGFPRAVHFMVGTSKAGYPQAPCHIRPRKGSLRVSRDWTEVTCTSCRKLRPTLVGEPGEGLRLGDAPIPPMPSSVSVPSMPSSVDHPQHYGGADNPYETIKIIEAWGLGFCLGNTVKYILRAGKKKTSTELEDLQKAAWYLQHKIEKLEKKQ